METSSSINWVNEHFRRAYVAIATIKSAKKQRVQDYDERLRRLTAFADSLVIKSTDEKQLEMLDRGEALPPEVRELLEAPLTGLD